MGLDRISLGYSRIWTEFCQFHTVCCQVSIWIRQNFALAIYSYHQNFTELQSSLRRILQGYRRNFVGLQLTSDRILSDYSQDQTEFCWATFKIRQSFAGLQMRVDRILSATIKTRKNFVRLQSRSERILLGYS